MAKKAKWLEEGTNIDLLEVITEALEETDNTTKINRGKKAVDELLERQPSDEASITDLLTEAKTLITEAQSIYEEEEAELIEMEEDVEEEEIEAEDIEAEDIEAEDEEEDEEDLSSLSVKELRVMAKEEGINIKGMRKADLIEALSDVEEEEEAEEEEEYEDEEVELEDMTLAELKEVADELEVDYPSKVRKPKLIALIEEAEEEVEEYEEVEEEEEEEELEDYEDMTLADLKAEARERGIRISKRHKRDQVIALLEADDAE